MGNSGSGAMSNIYPSLPDQVLCEVRKKNAARAAENSSYQIIHLSFLLGGKKCAVHYLKVLGSRVDTSSVTGTNYFALPVTGQCFCSCCFPTEYTVFMWLSLEAQWLPVMQFCICQSRENVEDS